MSEHSSKLSALDCDPEVRELIEYWRSLHPGSTLPGRRHFDPLDNPHLLQNLWLIDVSREPLRFRFRLIGTALVNFIGRDCTGMWFDEVYENFSDSGLFQCLRRCVEYAEPQYRRRPIIIDASPPNIEAEQVYLPLAADGRNVDMILAMTVFLDDMAEDGRPERPPQGAGPGQLLD